MPYAAIELNTLSYQIRVWREEESLEGLVDNTDIQTAIRDADNTGKCHTAAQFAELVWNMPRVNAVEVKDRLNGNAIIVYPVLKET